MSRIALISNPKSHLNRRGLLRIEGAAKSGGFTHLVLDDMADLRSSLEQLADDDIGLLVVNGGDGTLQAVLTALLEDRPFDSLPLLAVLPRGMTNMSAYDVGLTGRPDQALVRLAALWRGQDLSQNLVSRSVLRLENISGSPVQRAMFFGAGGICGAIDYCRSKVHPWRIRADWASGLTLMGLLGSWMLRGGRSDVVRGERIQVSLDNGPETSEELLLALATTLDRLVMNSTPFWHQRGEPLRYTAIGYPPVRLLRYARRVLYGGNERDLPAHCYKSRGAHRVQLRYDGRLTLDGQMFDAVADRPLVITAPDRVAFVRV
jgi:Diacylglycerol kinase catalytic domain